MTRYTKTPGGKYVIKGHNYEMLVGSRAQVHHGTAYKTSGGLTKSDLVQNKNGRIVSKAKQMSAKKEKRLVKAGYGTKKGKFGYVMLNGKTRKTRKGRKGSKKMRGGDANAIVATMKTALGADTPVPTTPGPTNGN
jgi:DVNP family